MCNKVSYIKVFHPRWCYFARITKIMGFHSLNWKKKKLPPTIDKLYIKGLHQSFSEVFFFVLFFGFFACSLRDNHRHGSQKKAAELKCHNTIWHGWHYKCTCLFSRLAPFILFHCFCFHSNLGWLYYGMLKTDHTLIVVNLIGALLQALYIVVYFKYTKQKVSVAAVIKIACVQVEAWTCVLLCFVLSEKDPIPNNCHRSSGDQRRGVLQVVSSSRWRSAQPAGTHLQRGHCGRVRVPARRPGKINLSLNEGMSKCDIWTCCWKRRLV